MYPLIFPHMEGLFCCTQSQFDTSWFWQSWDGWACLSRITGSPAQSPHDWTPPPKQIGWPRFFISPQDLNRTFTKKQNVSPVQRNWPMPGWARPPQLPNIKKKKSRFPTVRVLPAIWASTGTCQEKSGLQEIIWNLETVFPDSGGFLHFSGKTAPSIPTVY